MKSHILQNCKRKCRCCDLSKNLNLTVNKKFENESFPLRLAQTGERVKIVSVKGGRCINERLISFGLHIGAHIDVLHNPMNEKLLIGHEGARLYLGGNIAHKIQVLSIKNYKENIK